MRLLLAGVAGFALAVVPALAADADHAVTASGRIFTPETITIAPGDKVTWSGPGHTVHFDGEPTGHSLGDGPYSRTFDVPGEFTYFCDPHKLDGMDGKVVVKAQDPITTPTTMTTTTTTTTTQPSPSPSPSPTPAPQPEARPTVTVKLDGKRFTPRTGVRLRITSDADRTLAGTLRRAGRTVLKLRLTVREGTAVQAVRRTGAGRRLARGSYALTLRAAGVEGLPVTLRFRVR